jgi:hypothetical protein
MGDDQCYSLAEPRQGQKRNAGVSAVEMTLLGGWGENGQKQGKGKGEMRGSLHCALRASVEMTLLFGSG